MHVCRCKVYDDLPARYLETHGLERGYRPEQTFLYGGVSKANKVDSDTCSDVYFDCYGYGIYSDAFGAVDVYEHSFFHQISHSEAAQCLKKRKM